jgi:hypothetical protein
VACSKPISPAVFETSSFALSTSFICYLPASESGIETPIEQVSERKLKIHGEGLRWSLWPQPYEEVLADATYRSPGGPLLEVPAPDFNPEIARVLAWRLPGAL